MEEKKHKDDLQLSHNDLLIILQSEDESEIIDSFGQPGTRFIGEVRLADDWGEHYLLLRPTHIELGHGDSRNVEHRELRPYIRFLQGIKK
jgi:hypothetical protein